MPWATLTARVDGFQQTGEQKPRDRSRARTRRAGEGWIGEGKGGGGLPAAFDGERRWGFNWERALLRPPALELELEGSGSGSGFFVASVIGSSGLTPRRGGEAEAAERGLRGTRRRPGGAEQGRTKVRGRGVRTTRPRGAGVHNSPTKPYSHGPSEKSLVLLPRSGLGHDF